MSKINSTQKVRIAAKRRRGFTLIELLVVTIGGLFPPAVVMALLS